MNTICLAYITFIRYYCLERMREAALDAAHLIRGAPNVGVPRCPALGEPGFSGRVGKGGDSWGSRMEPSTATVMCEGRLSCQVKSAGLIIHEWL